MRSWLEADHRLLRARMTATGIHCSMRYDGMFHANICRREGISCRYACTGLVASVAHHEERRWCDQTSISWSSSVLQRLRLTVRDGGEQHSWIRRCCYNSQCGWWRRRGRASMQPQLIWHDGKCPTDKAGQALAVNWEPQLTVDENSQACDGSW